MYWPMSQITTVNILTTLANIFYTDDSPSNVLVHRTVKIVERTINIQEYDFSVDSMESARALARNQFPEKFLFGTGSSAYQIEGAYNSNGKEDSVWDFWSHSDVSPVVDKSNGDIACDSYHKYAEDVNLVKNLGAKTYRISLSWSRILPHGSSNFVNANGIEYYNHLINSMILNGITPMVTIHHYDIPEKLQLMGGWTNPQMVDYFQDYARVAFTYFGDRVKHWITINDPFELCNMQFGDALKPLYHDSGVGNYLCGHHVLLAHARVYYDYRSEFHWLQKGKVGISIGTRWFEPKNPTSLEDVEATELSFQFANYWFLNPLLGTFGGYPDLMTIAVEIKSTLQRYNKPRLPSFTPDQILMVKQSLDFLGINFFTSYNVQSAQDDSEIDSHFNSIINNQSIWNDMSSRWLPLDDEAGTFQSQSTPGNFGKLLQRLHSDYVLPHIYITANGYSDAGEIIDMDRALYHVNHLMEMFVKMLDGIDIRSYIAWSLLDSFEWNDGYAKKFGLYSVDFNDAERPRTEKFSASILKNIYKSKSIGQILEGMIQN